MRKLILLALLTLIMAGCKHKGEHIRKADSYVVIEASGCEYIMFPNAYGFQHKGNCKYCSQRDSIKWEKRKAEIVELLKESEND